MKDSDKGRHNFTSEGCKADWPEVPRVFAIPYLIDWCDMRQLPLFW